MIVIIIITIVLLVVVVAVELVLVFGDFADERSPQCTTIGDAKEMGGFFYYGLYDVMIDVRIAYT